MATKPKKHFTEQDHKLLAIWAADCAEHVLPYLEGMHPDDDRPRKATDTARAWPSGDLSMVEARKAAFAAHAAARDAKNPAAQAAARPAGQAAATAHVADHARHAATYAVKAAEDVDEEIDWQYQRLPEHLHLLAFPHTKH